MLHAMSDQANSERSTDFSSASLACWQAPLNLAQGEMAAYPQHGQARGRRAVTRCRRGYFEVSLTTWTRSFWRSAISTRSRREATELGKFSSPSASPRVPYVAMTSPFSDSRTSC